MAVKGWLIDKSATHRAPAKEGAASSRIPPIALMPLEYLTSGIEDRALEVQMLLADLGQRRAPSTPDLLIAATAELAGLTVLAADKDFNLIAQVTGQSVEALAQKEMNTG